MLSKYKSLKIQVQFDQICSVDHGLNIAAYQVLPGYVDEDIVVKILGG